MAFKLSTILCGHTGDVRGLAVTHDNCIVSCSRDKTARLWRPNSFNAGYTQSQTFTGHKNFVTCVCTIPPNSVYENGLVLTGGNDNLILVYEPSSSTPIKQIAGHENTVCKLIKGKADSTIVSASWDKTAKVWTISQEQPQCLLTLKGHEAAVWSVLSLPNELIVTGSADKTIKVFNAANGILIRTLTGHDDCVRDLASLNDNEIVSCSNDATVRKWSITTGQCVHIIYAHSNFIYSIAVFGDLIVSGGEDRQCSLWCKGEGQTITLPAQSVWTVAVLPNNDIVTGSSDGVVRIFTANEERQADAQVLESFANEVASQTQEADKHLGGIKISDLPGPETLQEPGTKEAQTRLVRENGEIFCYSWSESEKKWNKMGNVVGGSGGTAETSGKVLYEGKEYDYVFNVDVEDGKPALKLPYLKTEDPWFAAQAFIHKHNLPQQYLEQVAYFIINNCKQGDGLQITPPSQEYADPFTGGSRYVPTGTVNSNVPPSTDPFTGGNRYIPSGTPKPEPVVVADEFFPQKTYLRFDQANLNQILDKLIAFNNSIAEEKKFSDDDLTRLSKLANAESSDSSSLEDVEVMKKILSWPKDCIFPVLDILRLAVRNRQINNILCSDKYMFAYIKDHLQADSPVANRMLSFRILCNMFCHKPGEDLVIDHKEFINEAVGTCTDLSNKSLQIAVITVALNMSVVFYRNKDVDNLSIVLLNVLNIFPQLTEQEALFRGLVTLGTVLSQSNELKNCVDSSIKRIIENSSINGSEKVKQCSSRLLSILA